MIADAHAQALARAGVVAAVGVWQIGASVTSTEHVPSLVGGFGLLTIAAIYLRLEHRRSKRLDERTERMFDHLERLAGIARERLESDENADDEPPSGPPLPRDPGRPGARSRHH